MSLNRLLLLSASTSKTCLHSWAKVNLWLSDGTKFKEDLCMFDIPGRWSRVEDLDCVSSSPHCLLKSPLVLTETAKSPWTCDLISRESSCRSSRFKPTSPKPLEIPRENKRRQNKNTSSSRSYLIGRREFKLVWCFVLENKGTSCLFVPPVVFGKVSGIRLGRKMVVTWCFLCPVITSLSCNRYSFLAEKRSVLTELIWLKTT